MRSVCGLVSVAIVASALAAGCGGETAAPAAPGACTPSRDAWNATVRPLVTQHCASCHGATPTAGAPYTLLDYDALLRSVNDRRPVDRMATRLVEGTMPPPSAPEPGFEARRAIVQWASCGAQTPPVVQGVRASAPRFQSPARPLVGVEHFDLTAHGFPVGRDVHDLYQCFGYDAPVTGPRFIRRFELTLDQASVVHHIVLMRDPGPSGPVSDFACPSLPASSQALYAWAPGQTALEFPDGGVRVEPGQRFLLQIHYNNGASVDGIADSTGVRVFHGPPQGTEYGVLTYGSSSFEVAPRSTGAATGECVMRLPTRILASMPHMHALGSTFTQEIVRVGGAREPLIAVTGWRFDTQVFYDLPKTLAAGDRVVTTCTFDNPNATPLRSGPRTSDEMCSDFVYVTPPMPPDYCDEGAGDR